MPSTGNSLLDLVLLIFLIVGILVGLKYLLR